jgi:predicted DNA-binding transcriptional regulator YafY
MSARPQSQVRRQWRLLQHLAAVRYGYTLAQLAAALGVCPRTVRRDLEVLVAVGFPIARHDTGDGVAIRMVWDAALPRVVRAIPAEAEAIPDGVRTSRGGLALT